jgi:hypothetical protein
MGVPAEAKNGGRAVEHARPLMLPWRGGVPAPTSRERRTGRQSRTLNSMRRLRALFSELSFGTNGAASP